MKARVHCLCCSDSKVKFAELTNRGSSDLFSLQARIRADYLSRASDGESYRSSHAHQSPFPGKTQKEARVRMGWSPTHLSRT